MTPRPRSTYHYNFFSSPRQLLDLLFPLTCAGCNCAGSMLCDRCAQAVEPIVQQVCQRCGRTQVSEDELLCSLCQADQTPVLYMVRAAAFHTEPLRTMIHHFKYANRPELAEPLSRYLLAAFATKEWQQIRKIDVIVPVPMFPARQKERGYNQAELLARKLCKQVNLPLASNLLKRTRFTQAQVGLNAKERQQNVEDAFVASPEIRGKSLLLIDDVYTTGATLRACASAALLAGANQIYALALAIPTAKMTG